MGFCFIDVREKFICLARSLQWTGVLHEVLPPRDLSDLTVRTSTKGFPWLLLFCFRCVVRLVSSYSIPFRVLVNGDFFKHFCKIWIDFWFTFFNQWAFPVVRFYEPCHSRNNTHDTMIYCMASFLLPIKIFKPAETQWKLSKISDKFMDITSFTKYLSITFIISN